MMKFNKKIFSFCLFGLSCLLSSQSAFAEQIPLNRNITAILNYGDWAVIKFEPAYENTLNCGSTSANKFKFFVIEWRSDPKKKTMYATAMAAYLTGGQIGAGISGCWNFVGGVPTAYRFDFQTNSGS